MPILSNEEKAYISEAGTRWDGKTVHDNSKKINKKIEEAFDDIIWYFENMENVRGCLNTEFRSKYGDPKKSWEGKGAPKRGGFESKKVIPLAKLERLLELYILESEDKKELVNNHSWNKKKEERALEKVGKLKGSLLQTVEGANVEF